MILFDHVELLPCHQLLLQQDYISLSEGSCYVDSQYLLAHCPFAPKTSNIFTLQNLPCCTSVRSVIFLKKHVSNQSFPWSVFGLSVPLRYEGRDADFCCVVFKSIALLQQTRNTSVHNSANYN